MPAVPALIGPEKVSGTVFRGRMGMISIADRRRGIPLATSVPSLRLTTLGEQ